MKKRIALVLSILLVAIMSLSIFAACSNYSNNCSKFFKKVGNRQFESVATSLNVIADNVTVETNKSNKYGIVYKETTTTDGINAVRYMLYDVVGKREAIAYQTSEIKFSSNLQVWYSKIDSGHSRINLYDCVGTVLYTVESGNINEVEVVANNVLKNSNETILKFNSEYRFMINFKLKSQIIAPFNNIGAIGSGRDVEYGKDKVIEHVGKLVFNVYDRVSLSLNKSIDISHLSTVMSQDYKFDMLDDSNIVVQFMDVLTSDVTKYDCVYEGSKIKLSTYIINIETEKVKKVNFDFIIVGDIKNQNKSSAENYLSNYPNYVSASAIKDKQIASESTLVAFDNNLKIKFVGDNDIFGDIKSLTQVGDNMWMITKYSQTIVVDSDGKVLNQYIGNLTSMGVAEIIWGHGFRMLGGSVCKFDESQSFATTDLEILSTNGAITMYSKVVQISDGTTEIHVFRHDVISNAENLIAMEDSYFRVYSDIKVYSMAKDEGGVFSFCSIKTGNVIKSFENISKVISSVTLSDGSVLIVEEGGQVTLVEETEIVTEAVVD